MKRQVTYDRSGSYKRARTAGRYSSKSVIPYKRYRQPSTFNRCIIATTVDYDASLVADGAYGFGFSPTNLWVNGSSATAYPTSINNIWDLCRIVKVEMTILPGNDGNAYNANTLTSGTTNIPYVYTAFDPNTSGAPTIAAIKQNSTVQTTSLNHVIKRTFYPNFAPSATVDMGANRKNIFMSVYQDTPAQGVQVYVDLDAQVWTYCIYRISFKVFMEVRASV